MIISERSLPVLIWTNEPLVLLSVSHPIRERSDRPSQGQMTTFWYVENIYLSFAPANIYLSFALGLFLSYVICFISCFYLLTPLETGFQICLLYCEDSWSFHFNSTDLPCAILIWKYFPIYRNSLLQGKLKLHKHFQAFSHYNCNMSGICLS